MSQSKQNLRKKILKKRKNLTKTEQVKKSSRIIDIVTNTAEFLSANHIATYSSICREANPKTLELLYPEKHYYLPVLAKDNTHPMRFAPINETTEYKKNIYSIPEPICKPLEYISSTSLDLVIMPLLGFDLMGNRLGMGGGYYDRCFSFKKQSTKQKPKLLGFAYDFQEIDTFISEPWDIGLDFIVTETRLIRCLN